MKTKYFKYVNIALLPLYLASCSSRLDITKNAPDYSNKKGEFLTFGYASPTDGVYYENGVTLSTGEDYRTVERYKEYKEAGLNTMMIQADDTYSGESWDTSSLKRNMDNCVAAGIERCIVSDSRVAELSYIVGSIYGEGSRFATREQAKEYIANCMKDYAKHEVFFGIMLRDEPPWEYLQSFGQVYQIIKELYPNCYIESNLLPYHNNTDSVKRYSPNYNTQTAEEAYEWYINTYLDYSHAEKILMDSYPFCINNGNHYMLETHLRGCQILASICRDRGLEFEAVAQTYGGAGANGIINKATMNYATMEWQTNVYMMYGVKMFGYFTYWRKKMNNQTEWFTDGTSFITQDGERTSLWYAMKDIHQEMQDIAPVLTNMEYQGANSYIYAPVAYSTGYARLEQEEFALIDKKDVKVKEGHIAFMSEFKDPESGNYLYGIMNALSPFFKEDDPDVVMDYSIDFGNEYNAAMIYYRGEKKLVPLQDGVYTSVLDAGYAEYIMPYKA